MNDLPCHTQMRWSNDPANTSEFAHWSDLMDEAYENDPRDFDEQTGLVIQTMLSGEPVADMNKLYDDYEKAVIAYKEGFEPDYESYLEESQWN